VIDGPRIGEVLAEKYKVLRLIASGGMGAVYEAQHLIVGRRFAVKFLHPEMVDQPELVTRFRREASAAGALDNENIASILDFGTAADGVPYIIMELLAGEDLGRFLKREAPLPVARAAAIVADACRGLEAAHAAGIIHRDLKPENLFLCRRADGTDLVKILDFGIAKLVAGNVGITSVTRTGATLGTPFYMSPEQARGDRQLDHRADVYAMGVILFEALAAQRPHVGDSYNAILYHVLTQPPRPISSLRPSLPPALADLVMRTLAFMPSERPQSARELGEALEPFAWPDAAGGLHPARGGTPGPRPLSARERTMASRAPIAKTPTVVGEVTPAGRPGRRGLWVAAAAVLAAIGAVAIVARGRLVSSTPHATGSAPAALPAAAPATTPALVPAPTPPPPTSAPAAPPPAAPAVTAHQEPAPPTDHHRAANRKSARHKSGRTDDRGSRRAPDETLAEPATDDAHPKSAPPADSGDGELLLPFRER
jgi:serine/threonine-protein kinase